MVLLARFCAVSTLVLTIGVTVPDMVRAQDRTERIETVTIQIGDFPTTQTVPMAAYRALRAQGLSVTILSRQTITIQRNAPLSQALLDVPVSKDAPLTMTGWSVGVFR